MVAPLFNLGVYSRVLIAATPTFKTTISKKCNFDPKNKKEGDFERATFRFGG